MSDEISRKLDALAKHMGVSDKPAPQRPAPPNQPKQETRRDPKPDAQVVIKQCALYGRQVLGLYLGDVRIATDIHPDYADVLAAALTKAGRK